MPANALSGGSYAQTLSRGLCVLELLATSGEPLTLVEVAQRLRINRSVAYRLVRTLLEHRLVQTAPDDRYAPGLGLVTLARGVGTDLRGAANPVLAWVAEQLTATTILAVADGEEVVCLASVEPRSSGLRVTYREGLRHSIDRGASGAAILSGLPAQPGERPAVRAARAAGYARSESELEADTVAVSAPVVVPGQDCRAAVTALFVAGRGVVEAHAVSAVMTGAARVAASLHQGYRTTVDRTSAGTGSEQGHSDAPALAGLVARPWDRATAAKEER